MKKNFKFSIFIAIMFFGFINVFSICNVNAAYAYSWTVDGVPLSRGSSNNSGSASWVEDSTYTGGILTLNNYNGGQLKIECGGTGLGHVFAIELVGNNKITVENGVGIIANAPIVFIGDGQLIIEASVPIGSGYIVNNDNTSTSIENTKWNVGTTMTIAPTTNNDNNDSSTIIDDDVSDSELAEESKPNNTFSGNNLFKIVLLSYCIISLFIIIILIIKLKSAKKNL